MSLTNKERLVVNLWRIIQRRTAETPAELESYGHPSTQNREILATLKAAAAELKMPWKTVTIQQNFSCYQWSKVLLEQIVKDA